MTETDRDIHSLRQTQKRDRQKKEEIDTGHNKTYAYRATERKGLTHSLVCLPLRKYQTSTISWHRVA